ncbi:MAG: acyltransferase [Muribaculaceae bacterium]|nr:acyltransferase [Muribaculaceae bacterium]
MLLIVAHHYVVNSGLYGMLKGVDLNLSVLSMYIFGAWGKTGINCFIMITGWFMCKSTFTLRKFLKLYLQVIFYAVIIYSIFCLVGYEKFHPLTAALRLFPIKGINQGFTSCFLIFYLLIPFINVLIQHIDKKQHELLLIILLTIYTILPTLPAFSLDFNYVTWFSLIYLIAAYIRYYDFASKLSHKAWGWITVALILLSCTTVIGLAYLGYNKILGYYSPYYFVSDSNMFLALAIGVSSFMYFKDLKIPHSAFINAVGATTFGVLLIHANSDTMRRWLWRETVNCMGNFGESALYTVGYAAGMVLIIFAVCSCIDWCRIKFIEPHYMKLIDRFLVSRSKEKS